MSDQCQATTNAGEQCENPAGGDGYCHVESHCASDESNSHGRAFRKYDPSAVASALRECDGVVRDAAQRVGCDKSTVYEYIKEFEECADAKRKGREGLVDLSRSVLRSAMEGDDIGEAMDAAKHVSRHYDDEASEKQEHEHSGEGGGPMQVIFNDSVVTPEDDDEG